MSSPRKKVWAVTAFISVCSYFSPEWSCLWLINWFSSLTSCQFNSKRLTRSTIFLAAAFVVVFFIGFWHQLLVLSILPNFFPCYRLWWWCLQVADSVPQPLAVQEGLVYYGWLAIPLHSIVIQIPKRSHTYWLLLHTLYKQLCLKKLCSFPPTLSLLVCCFKHKFHMQTRGWLQKANCSRLRELEATAFVFVYNWMSSTHECCFEPSLSNEQCCKYSIVLPHPITIPLLSPVLNPRFYFGFGAGCGPFIRS